MVKPNLNPNKAIHSNINRTSTEQRLNVDKTTRDNRTNKQSIRQVKQKKQQQPKHLSD